MLYSAQGGARNNTQPKSVGCDSKPSRHPMGVLEQAQPSATPGLQQKVSWLLSSEPSQSSPTGSQVVTSYTVPLL